MRQTPSPACLAKWLCAPSRKRLRVCLLLLRGQKIGPAAEELVRDTYFSCAPGRELLVLRFLHFGYQRGKNAPYMLSHPAVAPLVARAKIFAQRGPSDAGISAL